MDMTGDVDESKRRSLAPRKPLESGADAEAFSTPGLLVVALVPVAAKASPVR